VEQQLYFTTEANTLLGMMKINIVLQ